MKMATRMENGMPTHRLVYSRGNAGPIPATLSPLVTTSAMPCAIPRVPSVATNGGKPSLTTSSPLAIPNTSPTPSAAAKATINVLPATSSDARTTPVSPRTAPMERSRPSVMMTNVIGRASSSRVEDWIPILSRFGSEANPEANTPKTIPSRTSRNATPGIRASLPMLHGHPENILFGEVRSHELPDNRFVSQDVGSVTNGNQFRKLRADDKHGSAICNKHLHQFINLCLGPYVDPSCRLVKDEHL